MHSAALNKNETGQHSPNIGSQKIKVGEFLITVRPTTDGKIIIWNSSGGGGEFSYVKFHAAIKKFYEDNF